MKKTQKQNSLYEYLCANASLLSDSLGLTIKKSNNEEHAAFFIELATCSTVTKPFKNSKWFFKEHHMTVEKSSILASQVMTPFHYTVIFCQKNAPDQLKVHAYFDEQLKLIHFQKKTTLLPDYAWSAGMDIDLDSTHPIEKTIPLTLNDIRELAARGKHAIFNLLANKAQFCMNLSNEIHNVDVELATTFSNNSEINTAVTWQKIIDLVNKYIELVRKQNRFSDHDWNDAEPFLQKVLDAALNKLEHTAAPHTQTDKSRPPSNEVLCLQPVIHSSETISDREEIAKLVSELQTIQKNQKNFRNLKRINTLIDKINLALSAFYIEHSPVETQHFIKDIREKLYVGKKQALSKFEQDVLTGNLPDVREHYDKLDGNIDLVHLFMQLLHKIESNMGDELTDKLIAVAHFFYNMSELYRSVLIVKQLHIKYVISTAIDFDVSMLTSMYLNNNFKAFKMYLDQGISPELPHSRWGRYLLNGLQSVVLCEQLSNEWSNDNTQIYINELFKHDANVECEILLSQETNQSTYTPIKNVTLSSNTEFVKKIMNNDSLALNTQNYSTYTGLFNNATLYAKNILEFALFLPAHESTIRSITAYVHNKILYLAFLATLKDNHISMFIWASHQGGASFHPDKKSATILAQEAKQRLNNKENNMLALKPIYQSPGDPKSPVVDYRFEYALNTTVRAYIFANQGDISTTEYLYQRFECIFSMLEREDQLAFVNDILELAIRTRLTQSENIAGQALLYLGATIALSLITHLYEGDYRLLARLLYEHGEKTDAISPEPKKRYALRSNAQTLYCVFNRLGCINPLNKVTEINPELRKEKIFGPL